MRGRRGLISKEGPTFNRFASCSAGAASPWCLLLCVHQTESYSTGPIERWRRRRMQHRSKSGISGYCRAPDCCRAGKHARKWSISKRRPKSELSQAWARQAVFPMHVRLHSDSRDQLLAAAPCRASSAVPTQRAWSDHLRNWRAAGHRVASREPKAGHVEPRLRALLRTA